MDFFLLVCRNKLFDFIRCDLPATIDNFEWSTLQKGHVSWIDRTACPINVIGSTEKLSRAMISIFLIVFNHNSANAAFTSDRFGFCSNSFFFIDWYEHVRLWSILIDETFFVFEKTLSCSLGNDYVFICCCPVGEKRERNDFDALPQTVEVVKFLFCINFLYDRNRRNDKHGSPSKEIRAWTISQRLNDHIVCSLWQLSGRRLVICWIPPQVDVYLKLSWQQNVNLIC